MVILGTIPIDTHTKVVKIQTPIKDFKGIGRAGERFERVSYLGTPEFRGVKKIEGRYDVIKGVQRIKFRFFDPMLRLDLMLDGYWTDFKTEKRLRETSHLETL